MPEIRLSRNHGAAASLTLQRGPGNVLSQIGVLKSLGAKTTKELGLDFDALGTEAVGFLADAAAEQT